MMMKKKVIIASVRMPLTHQFFHLEDRLERALFSTSGVSSDVGTGDEPPKSDLLSLSDAVSPSSLFSDSDSCRSKRAKEL